MDYNENFNISDVTDTSIDNEQNDIALENNDSVVNVQNDNVSGSDTKKYPTANKTEGSSKNKTKRLALFIFTMILTLAFIIPGAILTSRINRHYDYDNSSNSTDDTHNSSISTYGSISTGYGEEVYVYSNYKYYSFTPTSTGYYRFYTTSSGDTYGRLLDSDYSEMNTNDDGGTGSNFQIEAYLTRGYTYYIGVKAYGSSSFHATLYVSKR